MLEVSQRNHTTAACRRLARVMRELGWTALRVRGLTRGGIWSRYVVIAAYQIASMQVNTHPPAPQCGCERSFKVVVLGLTWLRLTLCRIDMRCRSETLPPKRRLWSSIPLQTEHQLRAARLD